MFPSILLRPEIIVPLGAFCVAIVAIIANAVIKIHRTNAEVRLKERMIDEGMSADDMNRVLDSELRVPETRPLGGKPLPSK